MSKPIETITEEEADKLIAYTFGTGYTAGNTSKARRNTLMILLMLDAGLRVGELSRLEISDLVYENLPVKTLKVREEITKRHYARWIPLSTRIADIIVTCLGELWFLPTSSPTAYAFYDSASNTHLSTRQIERIVGNLSKKSIGRKIHPHTLRHTFGTRLMRIANARVVQQLLGHKNLQTTQLYMHPNNDDLTEAINKIQ